MRRLLAAILALGLWMTVVPAASAYNLVPCSESSVFEQRAKTSISVAANPAQAKARFERYSQELCGKEDGLPHLIVDGSLSHAGDFLIPGVSVPVYCRMDWLGRSVLFTICKKERKPRRKRNYHQCSCGSDLYARWFPVALSSVERNHHR
ncbi:Photosystem I reaction center subunit III [Planktothrix agardhii]|nr:Photosystem I reaction center subunit III [Planktothrix agardhii]